MLEPSDLQLGGAGASRPFDALLHGYAQGTLDPYFHTLVEAHLILSDANRGFVRALEEEHGAELDGVEAAPTSRAGRDEILAAIYTRGWYGQPRPRQIDPAMPDPLARLVGKPLDELKWRFAAPGVKEHHLSKPGEPVTASLLMVKPGRKLPAHCHTGLEATLVLKGAFSDVSGDYRRGDVAVADPSIDHQPVADPGEPCICFVVTEGSLRLTGPIGRIVQRVFGA